MWRWATSSKGWRPGAALAVALAFVAGAPPAAARVFLTTDEALELAFRGCEVERGTAYLTEEQLTRARELAGVEIASAVVHPYRARCPGGPGGTAYFDAHRVRTLPETLMVVVGPEGRVVRLEVLAFQEPEEYKPREIWYRQFDGGELGDELALKRGIRAITGATLTARATTEAVRRVLALHRVLGGEEAPEGKSAPEAASVPEGSAEP